MLVPPGYLQSYLLDVSTVGVHSQLPPKSVVVEKNFKFRCTPGLTVACVHKDLR